MEVEEPLDESWIDQLEQPLGEAVKLPESIIFLGRTSISFFLKSSFPHVLVGFVLPGRSMWRLELLLLVTLAPGGGPWVYAIMCADMQERCEKEGGLGVETVLRRTRAA